jgi:hypothetical protein
MDGQGHSQNGRLNFCLMAAVHNIFLDALSCGPEKGSGEFIYNAIKDVLDWHEGDEKTVAFVSDTPSDMKVARNLLKNDAILAICSSSPCWNHVLSLFLGDLVSRRYLTFVAGVRKLSTLCEGQARGMHYSNKCSMRSLKKQASHSSCPL